MSLSYSARTQSCLAENESRRSSIPTSQLQQLLGSSIAPAPTMLLPDSVVVEDVLGRSRSIPYGFFCEYFLDWQVDTPKILSSYYSNAQTRYFNPCWLHSSEAFLATKKY